MFGKTPCDVYFRKIMEVPEIIQLPKFLDDRGNLSVIENLKDIPFDIARTYWVYDVPGGDKRGGHAYTNTQEFIVAISGSFDVVLHDGQKESRYHLNRSYYGLLVPQMTWRELENFSTNSLALILADHLYNDTDYMKEFDDFLKIKNGR
jgi:dTDP-4-dehydrorhamnose 3,5-epimerase-like enzyme